MTLHHAWHTPGLTTEPGALLLVFFLFFLYSIATVGFSKAGLNLLPGKRKEVFFFTEGTCCLDVLIGDPPVRGCLVELSGGGQRGIVSQGVDGAFDRSDLRRTYFMDYLQRRMR